MKSPLGFSAGDRHGFDREEFRLAGDCHAGITKALEGEDRPVVLDAVALEHIFEPRLRGTEIAVVEIAPGRQDFGVLDGDPAARLAANRQRDIAADVLAEIEEQPPLGIFPALPDRQRRQLTHRRNLVGNEGVDIEPGQPLASLVGRRTLPPGVVNFAEIDAGFEDRGHAARPGLVGLEEHRCIGSGAGPNLGDGADPATPGIEDRLARPADGRAQPAVGKPDIDDVGAWFEQRADCIGLIAQPLVVAGPAWCQQVFADSLAVDEAAIEAIGADPQRLATGDLFDLEALVQEGRRLTDTAVG